MAVFWPPPQTAMLWHDCRAKKEQNFKSSTEHSQPMVEPTDRGMPVTVAPLFSLGCVAEIN